MRFTIKQAGCRRERVGALTGFAKAPSSAVIETPVAALLTQGGSVVHLTAEVLEKVFTTAQLLWMPLSNTFQLEAGVKAQGDGVTTFSGIPEHISCATLHNVAEALPHGHFEMDRVPLWTRKGKKMINADRYMDVMEIFKPDMLLAIADNRTPLNESYKRVCKSVDRTCRMLDTCVNRYKASNQLLNSGLIGVIVGAGYENKCNECIQHILKYKDNLVGLALGGITDGSDGSFKESPAKLEEIFKRVGDAIPKDLFRVVEGCWDPTVILCAIEHGWDIFDGSYALKLTNAGLALSLNFDITKDIKDMCVKDLSDMKYKDDFRPILEDCECLACKKHTRAYINHLLNTRELLASVLLSIHNLHHFDQMFFHARHHIAKSTFQEYKSHITKQYNLYKDSIVDTPKENGEESKQVNKKVRVSETDNKVDVDSVV